MRWEGRRESQNVEDRRSMSTGGKVLAGGSLLGVVILVVVNLLFGNGDPVNIQLPQPAQQQSSRPLSASEQAADDQRASFVKVVLADTEDVWSKLFAKSGQRYPAPTLVLFRDRVQSACGNASAASGPFYCPADQKLYIDLSFYEELQTRFKAPGEFSMAYVVAHEVGHHIQQLMGTSEKVQRLRGRVSETEYNKYSVRMELQADFYAGVWANHAQQITTADGKSIIEADDINAALTAANAIGDDRLQRESQGYVVPESFTHGTSAQRMYWFRKGFVTGDLSQGDTFNATTLE
ncbi:MAG: zinc metallopeptidase [Sphingobacteriales bacterium]|nr:zinc metallopeptidase [Sphingobacteriales bacterium]